MREILGKAKTVRELLSGVQYSVDYYQREYNWKEKQIRELMEDLSGKFLEEHQVDHERHRVAEYPLHRLLARLTDYIEVQYGNPSRYHEYVSEHGRNRYEVEHIWADKPERHTEEFPHPTDFSEYRKPGQKILTNWGPLFSSKIATQAAMHSRVLDLKFSEVISPVAKTDGNASSLHTYTPALAGAVTG